MVLGIVGLFLFWIPVLGWILPVLAIIFGLVAISAGGGVGMGVAGLVLGSLQALIVIGVMGLSQLGGSLDQMYDEAANEVPRD